MPERSTSKDSPSVAPADSAAPGSTAPAGAAEAAPDAGDEAEGFANRAARRAHGKGRTPPPPSGRGKSTVGRPAVQNPRMYGNRRSG